MKVIIEAQNTPSLWQLPDSSAELRIYATSSFQTSDGQWIPQGTPGKRDTPHLPVSSTISANILLIPSFEIDSTVDALDNPFARYTAELVVPRERRLPFLSNFAINTLEPGDPSMTWGEIILFRNSNAPQSIGTSLLRQLNALIQLAAGALTKSSSTNTGSTALDTDPLDPIFPIAVGANNPLWMALQAGMGLVTAAGTGVLVNGSVTIPTAMVLADSKIIHSSMDANVSGALHVENIVPGVSFDIVSNNGGDAGTVAWMLTN